MLGLADAQADRLIGGIGLDVGEKLPQPFERIGL